MKEARNEWYLSDFLMAERRLPEVLPVATLPWETSKEEQESSCLWTVSAMIRKKPKVLTL